MGQNVLGGSRGKKHILTLVPFSCPFSLALVAFCLCSVSQLFAWFLTSNPWLGYLLMAWLHPVDLIV